MCALRTTRPLSARTTMRMSSAQPSSGDVTALLKRIEGYVGIVVVASNRDEGEP